MLSDAKVSMIQLARGTSTFSTKFIRDFDRDWGEVVARLQSSKADLGAITLVANSVEYKNVRT